MLPVMIVMVMLSHDGHWYSGADNAVTIRWSTPGTPPPATLHWRVMHGLIEVASAQLAMPAADRAARLRIQVPAVRVLAALEFIYEVRRDADDHPLASGAASMLLYPGDPLVAIAGLYEHRNLFVVDSTGTLSATLSEAGVRHQQLDSMRELHLRRPEVIVVAPGQLREQPFDASPLLHHAQAGAQVLILPQPQAAQILGYPVVSRTAPPAFDRYESHPLLSLLRRDGDLDAASPLKALRLKPDEPALAVIAWPGDTSRVPEGRDAAARRPVDALVVVKAVGSGRVVLSQFPLGDWNEDPRSLSFIADALEYLAGPVELTPPPSQRCRLGLPPPVPRPLRVPTVTVPPGLEAAPMP